MFFVMFVMSVEADEVCILFDKLNEWKEEQKRKRIYFLIVIYVWQIWK